MKPVHVMALLPLIAWLACGGPLLVIPGGRLSGHPVEGSPADWSSESARFVELETRPEDPYSVQLSYFVVSGKLYLDPAEGRVWLDHLRADPRVRARFGQRIYRLQAVLVAEPGELDGFDPTRFIYRLDPRP